MSLSFEAVRLPEQAIDMRRKVRQFLAGQRAAGTFTPRCSGWTF